MEFIERFNLFNALLEPQWFIYLFMTYLKKNYLLIKLTFWVGNNRILSEVGR